MRIRSLLLGGITLAFALVAARLVLLEVSVRANARLDAIQLDVQRSARDASSLLVLGQEYLLHRNPRAVRQWRATQAELAGTLAGAHTEQTGLHADVQLLREVVEGLPGLFDAVEAAVAQPGVDPARRDLLADQLVAETRRISDGAFALAQAVAVLRQARIAADQRLTRATMAGFALLVLLLAAMVVRRVLRPMAGLEAAAASMHAGTLGARSAYRAADELGALSRTFDAMAETLQERTARLEAALRDNEALLGTLRASQAFLDRTGRVAGVGGWELDLDSGALTWSHETRRIHEVDDAFVPDLSNAIRFYAPQARADIEQAVQHGMASGEPWDLELPLVTAAGRDIWVRAVGEAQFEGGRAKRLFGAFQDVTTRKTLELQLAERERFLRQVTDGLPIRIAYVDAERRYRFVNAAHCRRFGLERSAILGRTRGELTGSAGGAEAEARMDLALQGQAQRLEFEEALAGEVRHIESRMTPDLGPNGEVAGVFTTGTDITERKNAELELVALSSLLRTVLESASEVSIVATDPALKITVFNSGAERLLGHAAADMVGRASALKLHDPAEIDARARELAAELGHPVEAGAVLTEPSVLRQPREWTYVRHDGTRVAVSLVVTAMRGTGGQLFGYLGIAHDVTRQKQVEASMRLAMHQARESNRAKSRFLANMSHEIRTPMNAVIGLTYLLGQTPLDDEQAAFLAKIELASKSLLALINDVLDLSKVEAGELALERRPFNLRHLLKDLADVVGVQARSKGIGFEVEVPADVPEVLEGDAVRLGQVLTNLLANAVKFTERGGVSLRVRALPTASGRARLRLSVTDSGIGITPQVQKTLFTPFVQADSSMTRRFGGTGLGLSIVKSLVGMMGGEIGVASAPGKGSEFTVELAFALASAPLPVLGPAAGVQALAGVRVLVADDSDVNLEVAQRILELQGARVSLAGNGHEAVQCLKQQPQGFDIVLMDVQMPVLDGYEATRRIRTELGLQALPVVALTAGALTSERQLAADAGMNDFISKPFEPRELVKSVARHVLPQARPAAPAETENAALAGWPHIEGIEAADVCARLNGDVALFRSMLRRLLDEFAGLGPLLPEGASPAEQAARLHKLSGAAGMLGARALHRLAREAEAACRGGDAGRAQRLAREAQRAVRVLEGHAAPVLEAPASSFGEADLGAASGLDPQALDGLVQLLRQQSLGALERFAALAPALKQRLGEAEFAAMRRQVDDLQFDAAAERLKALQASSTHPA